MDVKPTFLALLCAVTVCGVHAGQVYKWVDPSGRVHFSDTPRQGWTPVDLSGPGSSAAATADVAADTEDAVAEAPSASEGGEADSAARDQLRAEECTRAKEQLESYKKAPKIVERDALGKEKEYSSDERLQLIEQQQKRVSDYCGPQTQ